MRMEIRSRLLSVSLAVTSLACRPAGQGDVNEPGTTTDEEPATSEPGAEDHADELPSYAPPVAHSQFYGVKAEYELTQVERSVLDVVTSMYTWELHDASLSAVLGEFATLDMDPYTLSPGFLRQLINWRGQIYSSVELQEYTLPSHVCATSAVSDPCKKAIEELFTMQRREMSPGVTRMGLHVELEGDRAKLMLAFAREQLRLQPIPVVIAAGAEFTAVGELAKGFSAPHAERVDPKGQVAVMRSRFADDQFEFVVRCEQGSGTYQYEVLAVGDRGIEVAANFSIYCGDEPPARIPLVTYSMEKVASVGDAVEASFELLQEERARYGVAPLERDERAAYVAELHSVEMSQFDRIAHVSEQSGDVSRRFFDAGIRSMIIRENVARGHSVEGIHAGLMDSPAHRAALLDADVTHVGIGVAFRTDETGVDMIFITQNFYTQDEDSSAILRHRIDVGRKASGLPELNWSPDLSIEAGKINYDAVGPDDKHFMQFMKDHGLRNIEIHRFTDAAFSDLVADPFWWTLDGRAQIGVALKPGKGSHPVLVVLVGR
jgi:hypothetical protein